MGSAQNESPFEVISDKESSKTSSSIPSHSADKPLGMPPERKPPVKRLLFSFLLTLGLMLLIGGAGFGASTFFASLIKKPTRVTPGERVVSVQVFEAESATVQELIQGYGTVRTMKKVTLSAQVAGEITETIEPLKIGQSVLAETSRTDSKGESHRTQGDLIVRIDPQTYQEKVDQTTDRLREDQAEINRFEQEKLNLNRRLLIQKKNVEAFRKEYERINNLVKQGIASPSDLTTAELDLSKYEDAMVQVETEQALIPFRIKQILARIQTHQNDLEIARLDLNRTYITSPISGQLSEIHVERGQYVRVGDPLVTIVNFDRVEIPVGIPLQDYLKIIPQIRNRKYPRATIRTNSDSSATWEGIVTRAAPVADTKTRTVQLFVVVDNKNAASPLLPGTFVSIRIDGPVYEKVIPVPREAIFQNEVFVIRDQKVEKRAVQQIMKIQSLSLIESGLKPADQVILTNLDILTEGDRVNPGNQENLNLETELKRLPFPFLRRID